MQKSLFRNRNDYDNIVEAIMTRHCSIVWQITSLLFAVVC